MSDAGHDWKFSKLSNGGRASSPGRTDEAPVLHRFRVTPDEGPKATWCVLLSWELAVQIQIQFEDVNSLLSEEAELARLSVLLN